VMATALTIRGQVGTLDGQSITQGAAALSLPIQFNCRAPIAAAEIDPNGTFAIQTVPGDQTYTLEIYAKGYHSKRITVATKNRNTNAVDLGSITLLPKAPGQADVIAKGPNPNWREDFDRIYRLNEEQTLRLVKAPFPLARQDRLINMTRNEGASDNMLDYPHIYTQYRWEGHLEEGCWYGNSSGPVRIQTVMLIFLDIPSYEFELPEELANTHLARGDWIARKDATTEEKILALQEIIHEELRQPIRFEKRQVERDAIVVTGRYAFAPLPEGDPNRLCVTVDEMQDLENDEAESLPQLFAWLANGINTTIDDRTEPTENRKILYSYDWNLLSPPLHVDRIDKKKLPLLLDNLAKQTGLTFTLKKRPVDVWFISEDTREGKG